jgi:methylmalonyl-CoA mutase
VSEKSPWVESFPEISTQDWWKQIEKDLKGKDPSLLNWKTKDNQTFPPFLRSENLYQKEYKESHRNSIFLNESQKPWEMWETIRGSQYDEILQKAIKAIQGGAIGLEFPLWIQSGKSFGANLYFVEEWIRLFESIPIQNAKIHFTAGSLNPALIQMILKNPSLHGNYSFDIDPIAPLVLCGQSIGSLDHGYDQIVSIWKDSKKDPRIQSIAQIHGRSISEAGGTIVQELAYTLGWANELLVALKNKGVALDEFSQKIIIELGAGPQFFLELAKFRSFRILWDALLRGHGVQNSRCHLHCKTSEWNHTLYDLPMNLLRGTTAGVSAILGGVDSLEVLPMDIRTEDGEFSHRLSRNIQNLVRSESYLDKVYDPAGGSYYLEQLTESLAESAWNEFLQIEDQGGFVQMFLKGSIQSSIQDKREQTESYLNERKEILVGTNQYPNPKETFQSNSKSFYQDIQSTKTIHSRSKNPKNILSEIEELNETDLRVLNEFLTIEPQAKAKELMPFHLSSELEKQRILTEKYAQKHGKPPLVYLVTFGNLAMKKARANFSMNLFGCLGYEIHEIALNDSVETTLSGNTPDYIVFCSSDEEYLPTLSAKVSQFQKALPNTQILIAGNPKTLPESDLKGLGIHGFIHAKSKLLEFFNECQSRLQLT